MEWRLADAKNRFSELVTRALAEGAQRVRRHDDAVVVAERDYEKLTGKRPDFKEFLTGGGPSFERLNLTRDDSPMREALERYYADRVLPVDLETSHTWGELTAAAQKAGKIVPASDGLIAATARRHGLHVMTRNTEHFEPTGVLLLNPWAVQDS